MTIKNRSVSTPGAYTALDMEKNVMAGYSYKYVVYYYTYEGDETDTRLGLFKIAISNKEK